MRYFTTVVAVISFTACGSQPTVLQHQDPVETAAKPVPEPPERVDLFDELLAKTLAREAFSPVKNARLNIDVERDMRALRSELMGARDDRELFQVLVKLSCVRKDRHLRVESVPNALRLGRETSPRHVPIRFAVHHGTDGGRSCFVADLPIDDSVFGDAQKKPQIGDEVVGVHGMSIALWADLVTPYLRYSTEEGLWRELARSLSTRPAMWPDEVKPEVAKYRLRRVNGEEYELQPPWVDPDSIRWQGVGEPSYPGFVEELRTSTFVFYLFSGDARIALLRWHGFREHLVRDMDRLMTHAEAQGLLDHDLIIDATRSRGGSRGAYAVQRLFPKSFKTTFGNLRLSDVVPKFIARKKREFDRRKVLDGGTPETMDDGTWLLNWLLEDVTQGLARGDAYSNNVPFKLAHLPKDSDGIIQPAEIHFRGQVVCFFGPHGGSHLDQFASIVIDNNLAHTIGMSTGGYSNTWEWEEVLKMPGSGRPLVRYMWSIGHTIRPNGEILEGNPAEVDDYVPTTRENHARYYELLLEKAMRHLVGR